LKILKTSRDSAFYHVTSCVVEYSLLCLAQDGD